MIWSNSKVHYPLDSCNESVCLCAPVSVLLGTAAMSRESLSPFLGGKNAPGERKVF